MSKTKDAKEIKEHLKRASYHVRCAEKLFRKIGDKRGGDIAKITEDEIEKVKKYVSDRSENSNR